MLSWWCTRAHTHHTPHTCACIYTVQKEKIVTFYSPLKSSAESGYRHGGDGVTEDDGRPDHM